MIAGPLQPPMDAPPDPSLLLSKSDLAGHLRISERQVDKLRPMLPAPLYLGTSPRWSRVAIIDWIAEQQLSAGAETRRDDR